MEGLGRHEMYLEVREKGHLVGQNSWDVQNRDNLGDKQELRGNRGGDSAQDSSWGVLGRGIGGQRWAGMILELCQGMDWDPRTRWVQERIFPVPTIIKRSLPFFTWIAEPWPWRWTTAGCKGEHRD